MCVICVQRHFPCPVRADTCFNLFQFKVGPCVSVCFFHRVDGKYITNSTGSGCPVHSPPPATFASCRRVCRPGVQEARTHRCGHATLHDRSRPPQQGEKAACTCGASVFARRWASCVSIFCLSVFVMCVPGIIVLHRPLIRPCAFHSVDIKKELRVLYSI